MAATFQHGANIFSNAANSVMLGISNVLQNARNSTRAAAAADAEGSKDTTGEVKKPWITYLLIAAGLFVAWKWLLPMLGIRKKTSSRRYSSLAKARAAKARKRKMAA